MRTWCVFCCYIYQLYCSSISGIWVTWPPPLIQQGMEPNPGPTKYVHVYMNVKSLRRHWQHIVEHNEVDSFSMQETWPTNAKMFKGSKGI